MTLIQVQLFLGHWQGLEAGREERRLFLSWSLNSAFSSWESITPYQLPVLLFLYPSPALSLLGPDEMHVSYFPRESVLQTVFSPVFGIPPIMSFGLRMPQHQSYTIKASPLHSDTQF